MLKRTFDVTAASIGLIVLAPLLALIAILVRATSRGPVIFRQTRVGKDDQDFTLFKFRSMASRLGSEAGSFDAGDTSRVTKVGALLRATKLDELPQLWNVLRGDMSVVGPRPEVRKWVETYPDQWKRVHTVRPGITDPAAIVFRDEERILSKASDPELLYRTEILPRKLNLYEDYIRTQGFWTDCIIIWRTALAVLAPRLSRA
jgi:lipopolysaccharide/colanic/teichoic acid biosynthesis glycosyltransferase